MVKKFHNIVVTVFSKEEGNNEEIKQKLKEIFPFDLEEEKAELKEKNATGIGESKIKIYEVELTKEKTIKLFVDAFLEKLTKEQKETLIQQKETRLDDELHFFIRLDKEKMLNDQYEVTDSGNCYHIKLKIASYPATKEKALQIIEEVLK